MNRPFKKHRTKIQWLQLAVIFCLMGLGSLSYAGSPWSFLPQGNLFQQTVVQRLNAGEYGQAAAIWEEAYRDTRFGRSTTAHASLQWILFKAGVEVSAVEELFRLKYPQNINSDLKKMWVQSLPASHSVWKIARLRWTPAWRAIFPVEVQDLTELHSVIAISSQKQLYKVLAEARALKGRDQLKSWKLWQVALQAPLHSQEQLSLNLIEELLKSSQNIIGKDQLNLAKGRVLYQMGSLEQAVLAYEQVPRASDFWIEALEEKAWTFVRQNRQDRALSELMTVSAPLFQPQVGPEPFFLMDLANLMICDYSKIFKTNKEFKTRFRPKLEGLQALAKNPLFPEAQKAIELLEKGDYKMSTVSSVLGRLPRLFHRDEYFTRHMLYRRSLVREQTLKAKFHIPEEVLSESLLNERAYQSKQEALARLQYLATRELKEFSQIIQKMHLAEAEVIQRMYLDDNLKGKRQDKPSDSLAKTKDTLEFPFSQEVWLDEIDNYHVKVKACPKLERAQL